MNGNLPTSGGGIDVGVPYTGRCDACGDNDTVLPLDTRDRRLRICGDCLAEGLAILFGRRHVQGGGSIDDLKGDPLALDTLGPMGPV